MGNTTIDLTAARAQGVQGRIAITGVAGFIGSHTAERLLDLGYEVEGIDCFTPYYDRQVKVQNLHRLRYREGFRFHEAHAESAAMKPVLQGVDAIIHLAAQPGVRDSWASFDEYVDRNITATKALLDTATKLEIPRFVYASSSSVYGDALQSPTPESAATTPRSPYGITKLAGERLAVAYGRELGLTTVSMRYFTVYGPRQRPDMAIQRLIQAGVSDSVFRLFGDGSQIRDFTFVRDVADANIRAATMPDVPAGAVYNVCSEYPVSMLDLIATIERVLGRPLRIERSATSLGDVDRTSGSADAIRDALGWSANTPLQTGIEHQVEAVVAASSAFVDVG